MSFLDIAPKVIAAAQNPEQFAAMAAKKGISPQQLEGQLANGFGGIPHAGGELAPYLEPQAPQAQSPLAGVKAPQTPAPTPFPGAIAPEGATQPIKPSATLVELMLNAQQQQGGGAPSLASLIGR